MSQEREEREEREERDPDLLAFQQDDLGYEFRDLSLLLEALTHSSYAYENPAQGPDNERLEFLGDSVLGAIISKQLYLREPKLPEGKMTRIRSLTVRSESLALIARKLHITDHLRLGQGEEKTSGRRKMSNAEDAMEAIVGAIFLDGGWDPAEAFVLRNFSERLEEALAGNLVYDYKSRLYERLQITEVNPKVSFVVLREEGPAHDKRFTVAVNYNGVLYPEATAQSKKNAEQGAAKNFLDTFTP